MYYHELNKIKQKNPPFLVQYPWDQLSHSHKRRDAVSGDSGDTVQWGEFFFDEVF